MRLDIALVGHPDLDFALNHQRGRCERRVGVAELEPEVTRYVGPPHVFSEVIADQIVQQYRRIVGDGLINAQDSGKRLVLDVDQPESGARRLPVDRSDRGHRVPPVHRLVCRQNVCRHVRQMGHATADVDLAAPIPRQVQPGHNRQHAGHGRGLRQVDLEDACMCVRASEDVAPDHSRHRHVGAVLCAPGHLVMAVVPDRPRSDDRISGSGVLRDGHASSLCRRR